MVGSDITHDGGFRDEVVSRFGVLPNFFCSVGAAPGLVEELWRFAKTAYLDNPLPSLFKERLFVHLSRFCMVRYCIVRHVGFLVGEGRPAGDGRVRPLTLQEVLRLLRRPLPDAVALEQAFLHLEACTEPCELPSADSDDEHRLFDALTVMFLGPLHSARAGDGVRRRVGPRHFEFLAAFLVFVRTAHYWTEMHPELEYESDMQAYMARHPDLARMLLDTSEAEAVTASIPFPYAREGLKRAEKALHENCTPGLIDGISQEPWRAEASLREREADLARVQRISEVGGLDIDIAGGMRSWRSPEYLRLHGLRAEDAEETHEQWLRRVHPEDRERAQAMLFAALDGSASSYDSEYRIVRPSDGSVRWIHARADIDRDSQGRATRLVGAHLDVTEQKRLQQALREREERQAFLLKLADGLRPLAAPQAIQSEAARQLGEHLGVDRAFYAEVDGGGHAVMGAQYRSPGTQAMPDRFLLDDFGIAPADALRAGQTLVIFDVAEWGALTPLVARSYADLGVASQIKVPLVKEGRLVAFLGVHARDTRQWVAADVTLVEDIAERTWAAVERARAEGAMRESEERLRSAIEVGQLGLWDWNVITGEVHWSDQHYRMEGYEVGEVLPSYEAWLSRVHPEDRPPTEAALRHAMATGEEFVQEFRVVHSDGSVHWLYGRGRFFYDGQQRPVRMIGAMVQTTDRRQWEDRQKVLVSELQHRTRNLMGVVRSMADKTLRASRDLPDFRQRFRGRLEALARVQGLLSRLSEHDRVTFDELIQAELSAMEGASARVMLDGPHGVRLRSSTVQMLALGLHELATNAMKYGALGQPDGRLSIGWRFEPEGAQGKPWLHIDWRESGVEMPEPGAAPQGGGQGRELIEKALPYQLQAKTVYVLGPDGVHCRISLPVSVSTLEAD